MDSIGNSNSLFFDWNFWRKVDFWKTRWFSFRNYYFLHTFTNGCYRFNYFRMVCNHRWIWGLNKKNINNLEALIFIRAFGFYKWRYKMKKRHQQKLVVLSFLLLLALNLPIVLLFDSSESFLGFPIIYIYVFSAWLFSILMSWIVVQRYYE